MPLALSSAILLACLVGCSKPAPEVLPGVSLELAGHRAATISQINYQLRFSIPPDQVQAIGGGIAISFDLNDASLPVQLDFRESAANITRIASNGNVSDYRFKNEHIVIPNDELVVGRNLLEIEFVAGSSSLNRNPEFLYTLFVPDRARTAFPLFDQPDLKATYELTLEIPADWTAMANAPVAAIAEDGTTTTYEF